MLLSHDTSFLHPSEAGWKELWMSCKLMLDIKPNNLNMLIDREECWESSHVSIWQIKSSNPAHGVSSLLVFILGIWVDLKNQCLVYYTAYWDWERPTTTNNRWKIFIHRQENVNHPSLYSITHLYFIYIINWWLQAFRLSSSQNTEWVYKSYSIGDWNLNFKSWKYLEFINDKLSESME